MPAKSAPIHVTEPRDPRHNALVHGLTANFPVDDHEHRILAEEIDTWTKELAPVCEAETAIIHAAAIARVRVARAARAEAAALRIARKRAEAKYAEKQRHKARKIAQDFAKDPEDVLDQLEATRAGRQYLAGCWRRLDSILVQGLGLDEGRARQFMHLMGFHGCAPGADAPMFCRQLWANLIQAQSPSFRFVGGSMPPVTLKLFLEGFVPPPDLPADEFAARKFLRDLCGSERLHLDELDQRAIEDGEADDEEWEKLQQAELNLVQTTPEARLRMRYAKEADQSLRANLNLLRQIRRDRHKLDQDERKEAHRRPPRDTYPRTYRNECDQTPKDQAVTPTPATPRTSPAPTPTDPQISAPTPFEPEGSGQLHDRK